jgi:hypothetical protein
MSDFVTISRLLGFNREFLARMNDPAQRDGLLRLNLLVMFGLLFMALSLGLMVWMLSSGGWLGGLWAAGASGVALFMLVKVHSLLITLGAAPLDRSALDIDQWRPSRLRLFAFAALAVVLSQPVLLWMQGNKLEAAAMERVKFRTTVQFEANERTRLVDRQQALLFQRSILNDERQRVMASLPSVGAKTKANFVESPRKALLVGASKYLGNVNPLPNVVNDIVAMERKLRSMGYAVTVSMDDSRTEVRRKLETYSSSLRSGDISLIYFSGHGLENAGHNYFIPRDFGAQISGPITRQTLQERAVAITPYIDNLTRERLRLHLLVLDACRTDLEGKPRGLARMDSMTSRNVIIGMSASPGQEALDGLPGQTGGNSPYTAALLRNLDRDEDVGRIFRRVTRDVVEATTPWASQNNVAPQTPTFTEVVIDLEIKLIPPVLEKKAATASQENANALLPLCSADYQRTGNVASLGACIDREIGAITRQIEFLEGRLGAEAGQTRDPLNGLLERAVFFAERMRVMWMNYWLAFSGTLALALLMIAGLVTRDLWRPQALRSYEKVRHRDQRIALREYHEKNQSAIDGLSAPLRRQEHLPRFAHWSSEEDFFASTLSSQAVVAGVDTRSDHHAATQMWTWIQNSGKTREQT